MDGILIIEKWISEFAEKNMAYSDRHIDEIYPNIKRKDWLSKTIEVVHTIKGLQRYPAIYAYCVITLNSLSHKSPTPSKLNNRSISSVICPPVFVLENVNENFEDFRYAKEISSLIGADAYYEEINSEDPGIYNRFIHVRI